MLLKEEILPHYQNPGFFRTCTNSKKISAPLHVRINGCTLYLSNAQYILYIHTFFDTLKTKDRKIRGNCNLLRKIKCHELE